MIIIAIATVFCTLFLVTRRGEKANAWTIPWVAVCVIGGIIATGGSRSEWDKTTVEHWAVQGIVISGPEKNMVFYLIAQIALYLIASYLLSRILNAVIRVIRAKTDRTPREDGQKRRVGTPLHPVCYCCNQPKSAMKDYPSRICGERICFDCLKKLRFKELFDTQLQLAAYGGKDPFRTADDVLNELRRRGGEKPEA